MAAATGHADAHPIGKLDRNRRTSATIFNAMKERGVGGLGEVDSYIAVLLVLDSWIVIFIILEIIAPMECGHTHLKDSPTSASMPA
jgi:hypothetical protein